MLDFRCGHLGLERSLHSARLQGNGLRVLTPKAFTLDIKCRGIVNDPIQRAKQGVILVETGSPMGRLFAAGEDNVEVPGLLALSSIKDLKANCDGFFY